MNSLRNPVCRRELSARVLRIRPDSQRQWGKMTTPQMICHLTGSSLGVMGRKPMEMPRGFTLWPCLKWAALYAPMEWPKGVPTRPEFDQVAGAGTPPAEFESDVRTLFETMEEFAAPDRSFEFLPHPMFKQMSEGQWMRWGYLHMDHHLRQFGQ